MPARLRKVQWIAMTIELSNNCRALIASVSTVHCHARDCQLEIDPSYECRTGIDTFLIFIQLHVMDAMVIVDKNATKCHDVFEAVNLCRVPWQT